MKATFGTGTFALVLTGDQPRTDRPGLLPTVAWRIDGSPPQYALDGGDYTAAAAVEWATSIGLANSIQDFGFTDSLTALERGIVFVPALAGLAAPYWDRLAAGSFFGLRQNTSAATLRQAVLEGVALRAVELVELLSPGGSAPVSVDGGMTRNDGFVQFLADALDRLVLVHDEAELTGLGAAQLGYVGLSRPPPAPVMQSRQFRPSARSSVVRSSRETFNRAIAATQLFRG
jgi:glycerol kinase